MLAFKIDFEKLESAKTWKNFHLSSNLKGEKSSQLALEQ